VQGWRKGKRTPKDKGDSAQIEGTKPWGTSSAQKFEGGGARLGQLTSRHQTKQALRVAGVVPGDFLSASSNAPEQA